MDGTGRVRLCLVVAPCPPRLRVFMRMAILPNGPTACNRGDRTDGTDGTPTSHEETLAYYCELRHHAAVPGLRLGVSTSPREPDYRVEDWTWEARRVRSTLRGG